MRLGLGVSELGLWDGDLGCRILGVEDKVSGLGPLPQRRVWVGERRFN